MNLKPQLGMQTLAEDTRKTSPDTDAADARLAAAGDVPAFERLYRRYVARIHSLARRMAGAEEADELTQEIFVRTWEKLEGFRGEAAFATWLQRLALNLILSRRKRLAIQGERFARAANPLRLLRAPRTTPDLAVDLDAAIESLPEGARQIFVLHDVEGYRHEEIAQMLGVTSGTSKSQLHRARMLLRAYFRR